MSNDDRMSLDEAELWFDYWEMTGERVTAVERAAAEVLRAEYDRRGAALAERDAEIERLRSGNRE